MRRVEEGQALIVFLNTLTGDNAKKLDPETRPESIDPSRVCSFRSIEP